MNGATCYSFGCLVIHLSSPQVLLGGQPVRITPREYGVLAYLAQHPGQPVSPEELLREVWRCRVLDGDGSAQVKHCIYRLRRKLEPDPNHPRYLLNQHGFGYCLPPSLDSTF